MWSPWKECSLLAASVTLILISPGVNGQCVARGQNFNEPLGDPVTISEEIKPGQLLEDLFAFFKLVRNEFYYTVSDNITMTKAGDPGCSVIGEGISLEMIKTFPPDWTLPLLTDIRILGTKLYIPGNQTHTLVTLNQFVELVNILGLQCDIKLNNHPNIVVDLSTKTLSNFRVDQVNT